MKTAKATRSLLTAIVLLSLGLPAIASAESILPLIVDGSGENDVAWWVDGREAIATPFERALEEHGSRTFMSPRAAETGSPISRIYKRHDLSTSNAGNLGRLLGVTYVLRGRLIEESARVPIAEEVVSKMLLDADVIDTRTQSTVANLRLVAARTAGTTEEARDLAAKDLLSVLEVRADVLLRLASGESQERALAVTVLGTDTATPFVQYRRTVRERLGDRGDIIECSATEGSVTLCFEISDAAAQAAFREELRNMEGEFVEVDVRVSSVEPSASGLVVELESGQEQEAPELPFP